MRKISNNEAMSINGGKTMNLTYVHCGIPYLCNLRDYILRSKQDTEGSGMEALERFRAMVFEKKMMELKDTWRSIR